MALSYRIPDPGVLDKSEFPFCIKGDDCLAGGLSIREIFINEIFL
jgi:hypothetical protein